MISKIICILTFLVSLMPNYCLLGLNYLYDFSSGMKSQIKENYYCLMGISSEKYAKMLL